MSNRQLQLQCAVCDSVLPHTQEMPSHVMHLLLTLFTAGAWLVIWLLIAMSNRGGDPATCSKCGNRRLPTGAATVWTAPAPAKPMSKRAKIIILGVTVAAIGVVTVLALNDSGYFNGSKPSEPVHSSGLFDRREFIRSASPGGSIRTEGDIDDAIVVNIQGCNRAMLEQLASSPPYAGQLKALNFKSMRCPDRQWITAPWK